MSLLLTLLSSSTEILVKVFQSCATIQDMIALAAACRHLHSVMVENSGQIISAVGSRTILCFDDALVAIRATQIVKQTQSSGQLPPKPFPFKDLGGAIHKPTLEELEHVCNLQHMVRCIEYMLFNWEMEDCEFKILPEFIDFHKLEEYGWNSWKQNFYRSMYRVIHAGCVCSRAYTEPFYEAAMKGDIAFFNRWQRRPDPTAIGRRSSFDVPDKDIEYLRRWPVYNFDVEDQTEIGEQRDRELEDWFGPFAEWLVSDGKSRDGRTITHPGVNPDDPPFVFQSKNGCDDILRLLAAYEHLTRKIACGDGRNYYGRLNWDGSNPPTISGRVRKVNAVLFGVFQVEEITMPVRVEDSAGLYLIANPLPSTSWDFMASDGDNMVNKLWTSYCLDIEMVLGGLGRISTRPNYHNGYPAPGGILQFFLFSLRKYFALTIDQRSFEPTITQKGLVTWHRLTPAASCDNSGTVVNTASQLQIEYELTVVMEDMIFYDALLTDSSVTVIVSINEVNQPVTPWSDTPDGDIGIYHGSVPFTSGTVGPVIATLQRGSTVIETVSSSSISNYCPDNGLTNWNPWVGGEFGGSTVSTTPTLSISQQAFIAGIGAYDFADLCEFSCSYGYCPLGAYTCLKMGKSVVEPAPTLPASYTVAGENEDYHANLV